MKQNGRGNALLVELLIVVLFFMLAATTLMEIFGAARQNSSRAAACSTALLQAQNMAEQLYAADDMCAELSDLGFAQDGDSWRMDCGAYVLTADYSSKKTGAGELRSAQIAAQYGDDVLFTLPATRYVPGEVAQ